MPTVPTDAPEFRDEAILEGPHVAQHELDDRRSARRLQEGDLAEELRQRSLALVDGAGFFEYFSPLTGRGYGAPDFSWTAALTLELLAHDAP